MISRRLDYFDTDARRTRRLLRRTWVAAFAALGLTLLRLLAAGLAFLALFGRRRLAAFFAAGAARLATLRLLAAGFLACFVFRLAAMIIKCNWNFRHKRESKLGSA